MRKKELKLGRVADVVYLSEKWFEEAGKKLGIKPRQNPQLKVTEQIAKKIHATRGSGFRKFRRVYLKMGIQNHKKPLLDRPLKDINRILQ